MSDDIKAVEKRGYAKGYAAGRHRKQRDISAERHYREEQAFLDRAYLALLPVAMEAQGWTISDKPVQTTVERITLAVRWARTALRQRPSP